MAEEEDGATEAVALAHKFHNLICELKGSSESTPDASSRFCRDFCQVLLDHGKQWRPEENHRELLETYVVAIACYAEARQFLRPECEEATEVLEKLSWSCLNLLLSFPDQIPGALWEQFQSSVKAAHGALHADGNSQLHSLWTLSMKDGVWTDDTLCGLLSNSSLHADQVNKFLAHEGPELLHMRINHLIKQKRVEKAARLAKACAEFPEFGGKKNFKQIYLVCLCESTSEEQVVHEIKEMDCKEALDMICNLESEQDDKGALGLCTAFLKRQLLSGDVYCAWELTLFWSKLLIRLESKPAFLEQSRVFARLSGSVYHILLLIKVIQAEVENGGLSVCIEMCIQALKIGAGDDDGSDITICKTISCLLPLDLEVKQACQLTEFLLKPSVDSYYAVEALFNQPDQKLEQDEPPILNSLRCDLLLALKTKWPFDPEFWDWKTLKRHCLALMGQEAAAVLSADRVTDSEDCEVNDSDEKYYRHLHLSQTPASSEFDGEKKKKREMKKVKEKGFVSARFRNWQAYMQYCVLCDKEFLGHRIVKHALKHVQDGIFRCPICTQTFENIEVLEPHVAMHVKQSCKERLAAMNVGKKHPKSVTMVTQASNVTKSEPCHMTVEEVKQEQPDNELSLPSKCNLSTNMKSKSLSRPGNQNSDVNNTKDYPCPVTSCQKVLKYFRNLIAHVKAHKNEPEATQFLETQSKKAMCQYCRRQFVNATHLNDHLQLHCADKPFFCVQLECNSSFSTNAELVLHREVHAEFKAQCTYPNCHRVFSEAYLLYDHEAQHYITFPCKIRSCHKVFYSSSELELHQTEHANLDGLMLAERSHCPALEVPPNERKESKLEDVKCKDVQVNLADAQLDSAEKLELPISRQIVANITMSQTTIPSDGSVAMAKCTESPKQKLLETKQKLLETSPVKLEPVSLKINDSLVLNAFTSSDSTTETPFTDKKPLSIQCGQVNQATPKSEPPAKIKTEERLTHVCPFEGCTRRYSTSKSLSRHVKNVHSEAFEEWKLSKKYKRIAKMTAKKFSSKSTSLGSNPKSQSTKETIQINGLDATFPPPLSVSAHGQCRSAQVPMLAHQTGLMDLPMSQTWPAPPVDNRDSRFFPQNSYPAILPGNLPTNPYAVDYTPASSYGGAHASPSVMNDVSSSLRVLHALNGDQSDMAQVEASVPLEYSRPENTHLDQSPLITSLLNTDPLPGQSFAQPFSMFPPEGRPVEHTDSAFSSDFKCPTNMATMGFKNPAEDFPVSDFSTSSSTNQHSPVEFCNHDLMQEVVEELCSPDATDSRKSKKVKLSKRTKWPAIIQDGKVICSRCYREFSSTKSLGGHLSKRSQCRPVDEYDLTADLPMSFLEFLNDPDISTAQMPPLTDDTNELNSTSCANPPSESFIHNPPSETNAFNNSFIRVHNAEMSPVAHETVRNTSFTVSQDQADAKDDPASSSDEGKILEIEKALQRLGLVDMLGQDKVVAPRSELKRDTCQNNAPAMNNAMKDQDVSQKPFKCHECSVYGVMTKEALFKHLYRIHNYSEERINELKKNPDRLSPYSCHLCPKTFTRTTGLKIHYKNVHHFTREKIINLNIGCRSVKTFQSDDFNQDVVKCDQDPSAFQLQKPLVPDQTVVAVKATVVAKQKMEWPQQNATCVSYPETSRTMKASQPLKAAVLTLNHSSSDHNDTERQKNDRLLSKTTLEKASEWRAFQSNGSIESKPVVAGPEHSVSPVESISPGDAASLYRPYRCVHEGCVAAFSIQQNLVLHYRAMHQAGCHGNSCSKDVDNKVPKFKCKVKQCSKVVSKVTSLLKHYLVLHRCTMEKASALLSGVTVGIFQCDHSKCPAHFTCHLKYIDHIKNDHKALKVTTDGDLKSVDLAFKCQFEGCDRVYTTKSNLLRHLMKKHDATFDTMREKMENAIGKGTRSNKVSAGAAPTLGKENITKKIRVKRKANNSWMIFANPVLKSIDEAFAMCSGSFPQQFPCMIASCDSVMSTENTILKHYTTHGLKEKYIADRRSQFIICKKSKETTPWLGDMKMEMDSVAESPPDVVPKTDSQPVSQFLGSQDLTPTVSLQKKRGRPRKSENRYKGSIERKSSLRRGITPHVKCMLKVSGSILGSSDSRGNRVEKRVALKMYKPSKVKTSSLKPGHAARSTAKQRREKVLRVVKFRNPLKIKTVKDVKIVMHENVSTCSDLLLKQLQYMQPMVVLQKGLHS